jgi:hypothetical protein
MVIINCKLHKLSDLLQRHFMSFMIQKYQDKLFVIMISIKGKPDNRQFIHEARLIFLW